MPDDNNSRIKSILSDQEIESLRLAQDLYGAKAKEAADSLADTLELDENARNQLIGGVALKLDRLDFEERRKIALGFQELAISLGDTAVRESSRSDTVLDLIVSGEAPPLETPERSETSSEEDDRQDIPNPLNRQQRSWLSHLYDEDDINKIELLSLDQRKEFVDALTSDYRSLKITRLSPEAKKARSDQLIKLLMGNASYRKIANDLGIQDRTFRAGMDNMAKGIKKRMPLKELKSLIPSHTESLTEAIPSNQEQEETEPKGLTKIQRKWLEKVYDTEAVEMAESLNPQQLSYLADRLGRYLNSAVIRAHGRVKTMRRLGEVSLLLTGHDYEEISRVVNVDAPTVKSELHHSATRLKDTTAQDLLKQILLNATLHMEKQ